MKYVGGKHRIGEHIAKVLMKVTPDKVNGYLEPFVGSLGVFKHMAKLDYKKKIGADYHKSLTLLWQGLQNGSFKLPKKITEKQWSDLKKANTNSAMKALAGFGVSFGGDYFSGYIQKYSGTSGRNFYKETTRSITKMLPVIKKKDVSFVHKSYKNWNKKNWLIYCDPPYFNTKGYKTGAFNNQEFWTKMRQWSKHNYVFVSEETAPKDFISIWSKSKPRTLMADKSKIFHGKEHVFVLKGSKAHLRVSF